MPRETMERKTFRSRALKIDEAQGIVEHIVAVCGNVDLGDDRIKSGAFTKTIVEQGQKVRVLDQHRTDTIMAALGRPLSLREIGRSELPDDVREDYPEATGALVAVTQYLMDTPEGKGAFIRIAEGAVDEYSIGYEALDSNYETVKVDGKDRTVRNLTTIRLWEYGPVLWGMNEATQTIGVKDGGAPPEEKPWDVFEIDGEFCVYKIDADGARTGETLGCHAEQEDANNQLRALYANEAAAKGPDAAKGSPHIAADGTAASGTLRGSGADDSKSVFIGGIIAAVRNAFYSYYPDISSRGEGSPWRYFWVKEVWDDFVIVEEEDQDGRYLWKISYSIEDDAPVFAERAEWIQGVMMFIPLNIIGEDMVVLRNPIAPASETRAALEDQLDRKAGPATPPTSVRLADIEAELREIDFMEVTS